MRPISAHEVAATRLLLFGFLCFLLTPIPSRAQGGTQDGWKILDGAIQGDKTVDRVIAIRVLGLLPDDTKAAGLAAKALDDPKPEIRAAAATALGQMGSTASIPKLKTALSDKDVSVALAAAHALNLMQDDYAYEVYYAILTGQRKSSKGLIAEQLDTLRDPKKMAQFGFSEGIGYVPFAGIGWDAFRAIKSNDSSPVRAAAASVLATDTDPKSGEALVNAVADKDWVVRVAALEALAKRKDPAVLTRIQPALLDSRKEVRYTGAAVVLRLNAVQQARDAK